MGSIKIGQRITRILNNEQFYNPDFVTDCKIRLGRIYKKFKENVSLDRRYVDRVTTRPLSSIQRISTRIAMCTAADQNEVVA